MTTHDTEHEASGLPLGPPFALSVDCALLDGNKARQIEGCIACVACDCGQKFRLNLLGDAASHRCPGCKAAFTSVLIVAPITDGSAFVELVETVLESNGVEIDQAQAQQLLAGMRTDNPDDEQTDDDDDEQTDDDEGTAEPLR